MSRDPRPPHAPRKRPLLCVEAAGVTAACTPKASALLRGGRRAHGRMHPESVCSAARRTPGPRRRAPRKRPLLSAEDAGLTAACSGAADRGPGRGDSSEATGTRPAAARGPAEGTREKLVGSGHALPLTVTSVTRLQVPQAGLVSLREASLQRSRCFNLLVKAGHVGPCANPPLLSRGCADTDRG